MNVLSLFAGIGGLDLGLERAGMATVGQVEINPFCQRVLARHWPEVPRHDDVRTAVDWWQSEQRPRVDVVAGGYPCQPFSDAGRRHGVGDERWGWPWMEAVVRAVRPRYVIVENVPGLIRDRVAFGWMLADLHHLGFDAEWGVFSACSVGAPHTRKRLFLVAHPSVERGEQRGRFELSQDCDPQRHVHHWQAVPEPHRVADGVADRMDRLAAIGNAVVPAVAEHIGRLIMTSSGVEPHRHEPVRLDRFVTEHRACLDIPL